MYFLHEIIHYRYTGKHIGFCTSKILSPFHRSLNGIQPRPSAGVRNLALLWASQRLRPCRWRRRRSWALGRGSWLVVHSPSFSGVATAMSVPSTSNWSSFSSNRRDFRRWNCSSATSQTHSGTRETGSKSNNNSISSSDSSASRSSDADHHHSVLHSLRKLENSMRYHGYSTIRIGVVICIVMGATVYLLRDPIRENVAVEVSQVASRSLEHEDVVGKAEEFAKSLLHTILHDDNMHRLAAQFIKQVLNSDETRGASLEYVSMILEDPHTRQLLATTVKQVLLLAINDPETTAALKAVVVLILSDPESQRAARELITAVFRHEDLKAVAADFFADVMKLHAVVAQATRLGKDVTRSVITDPSLKEETGKSLWQAVKYSVTPGWLSASSPTADAATSSQSSSISAEDQTPSPPSSPQSPLSSSPQSPLSSSSSTSSTSSPPSSSSPPSPSSPSASSSLESVLPPSQSDTCSEPLRSDSSPASALSAASPSETSGRTGHDYDISDEEHVIDEDTNILT